MEMGSAGAADRGVPELLDGRVDELVVAGQLGLDVPGPLVGEARESGRRRMLEAQRGTLLKKLGDTKSQFGAALRHMTPRSSRTARNWFIKDVRSRTA